MVNDQSDTIPLNDPSLLDYLVAGAVVLFFGLLYLYLNSSLLRAEPVAQLKSSPPSLAVFAEPNQVSAIQPLSLPAPSWTASDPAKPVLATNVDIDGPALISRRQALIAEPTVVANATLDAELERLRVTMSKQQQTELEKLRLAMEAQQATELERVRSELVSQQATELEKLRAETEASSELASQQATELEKLRAETDAVRAEAQAKIDAALKASRSNPVPTAAPVTIVERPVRVASVRERRTLPLPNGQEIEVDRSEFERQLRQYLEEGRLNSPIVFDKISFEIGSANLNGKSEEQIKVVAALMNKYPQSHILISGHTDNTGELDTNAILSLARSNNMKNALVDLGIENDRVKIEGLGPFRPIATNSTEEGRRLNRRIELSLVE